MQIKLLTLALAVYTQVMQLHARHLHAAAITLYGSISGRHPATSDSGEI